MDFVTMQRNMNRRECIRLFSVLIDRYFDFVNAYESFRGTTKGVRINANPLAKDAFDREILPMVERLCGKWYTEGWSPVTLPHPVQVAISLKNGRKIDDQMAAIGCTDILDSVRKFMDIYNIKVA